MKRGFHIALASIFLIIGFIYIINSVTTITGFAIAENVDKAPSTFIGLYFLFSGIFIISTAKNREKRGQAAMEFLMTYGWAILAAIIAIGVLAYFGIFNPGRLAGSSAVVNAPFNVRAFDIFDNNDGKCGSVTPNDCIKLELIHNAAQSVTVQATSTKITYTSGAVGSCWLPSTVSSWQAGAPQILTLRCDSDGPGAGIGSSFVTEDTIVGSIQLTYRLSGSTLDQVSTGSIKVTAHA